MSVLSITGSGYFPFCLPPATGIWDGTGSPAPGQVGQGTAYPIGLSLADAMRWYWQVQSWEITAAFNFSGTDDAESDNTFSEPLDDSMTAARSGPQNSLVCPTGVANADGTIAFTLWDDGDGDPFAYTLGDLIYPLLILSCANEALTITNLPSGLTFPKPWPDPASMDGNSLSLWYDEEGGYDSTTGVPGDAGPWVQSKSGTATISVASTY